MSIKQLNELDNLYDRLFRQQIEGYWKEACETQKEIQRLEDGLGENYKEPVRKLDVC